MSRGRQTDLPAAARAAALDELEYSAPQIEGLTGLKARTVWGILNNEASWGEIKKHPSSKQIALDKKTC
jgi:hypothetical protein